MSNLIFLLEITRFQKYTNKIRWNIKYSSLSERKNRRVYYKYTKDPNSEIIKYSHTLQDVLDVINTQVNV